MYAYVHIRTLYVCAHYLIRYSIRKLWMQRHQTKEIFKSILVCGQHYALAMCPFPRSHCDGFATGGFVFGSVDGLRNRYDMDCARHFLGCFVLYDVRNENIWIRSNCWKCWNKTVDVRSLDINLKCESTYYIDLIISYWCGAAQSYIRTGVVKFNFNLDCDRLEKIFRYIPNQQMSVANR